MPMGSRIRGPHGRVFEERDIGGEGAGIAAEHRIDQRLLGHPHQPDRVGAGADAIAGELHPELPGRVEGEQQQEAEQDRALHACPQPTRPTPTAIRAMASALGSVMCSRYMSRPPSITPTMVMLPAITPWPSGTRERKASQARNRTAN